MMKMKKLLTILTLTSTTFSLMGMTSCGKEPSSSSITTTTPPTSSITPTPTTSSTTTSTSEQDLLAMWVQGYAFSSQYEGDYTIVDSFQELDGNNTLLEETEQTEGGSGYNYFHTRKVKERTENGNMSVVNFDTIVLKPVLDNGVERTKLYTETLDEGEIVKEGSYVAPDYASYYFEDSTIKFRIYEDFVDCGTDANEFLNDLNRVFLNKENYEKEPDDVKWKKENDGTISLTIKIADEYVDTYEEEKDATYQKSYYNDEIIYYVKDGKIVSSQCSYQNGNIYEDETKNYSGTYKIHTEYRYEFDQEMYDSFDIETDETINEYYGHVRFIVEGYNFLFSDSSCLVGENYTAEQSIQYLSDLLNFIIHPREIESPNEFLALYTDKEMTQPFTSMTMEEDVTLYVKFVLPEDWAVVITLFKRMDGYVRIQLAYLQKVGSTFRSNYVFQDYTVLEIDGKEVKEGDSVDILLAENRVYTVLYDANRIVL